MSLLLQSSRATLPCRSYCSSSCCSFSEPAAECAGCDSTKACNPVAKCYQASTRPPPPPPLRTTAGVCEFVCEKASCCGFSQPATSCAGCFEPYACRPGTDCYELGSATPKHQHTPSGATGGAGAAAGRHAHTPRGRQLKKHEHSPAEEQWRKQRHTHSPASSSSDETSARAATAAVAGPADAVDGEPVACIECMAELLAANRRIARLTASLEQCSRAAAGDKALRQQHDET